MFASMKAKTETKWSERVEQWKASGQKAADFAEGKPYTRGTLVWAASELRRRADKGNGRKGPAQGLREQKIRMAEVVRRVPQAEEDRLLVEVAGVRLSVRRGFDSALLQEVVQALRGAR